MGKMVTLTIDGQPVSVPAGTLIVDAAKQIGIDIPVFCYHPKMEPVGMCRMCLVDIGRPTVDRATGEIVKDEAGNPKIAFGPKLDTACTTPVSEGMVVVGMSDKVKAARRDIVEFLLTSHPLDCPVCDKGGECPLQNLTMEHGASESRFLYDEKHHAAKHVPLGDLIYLDRERCIQCGRCVRFQRDLADDPVIGFYQRGRALEITTFSEPGFDSVFSGNTTDICPVGALTTADFRFGARSWELWSTGSVCPHCAVGCNLTLNTRREAKSGGTQVIKRVMPRQNEAVNEIWICDKGRFGHHFVESPERLQSPLAQQNGGGLQPVSWDDAVTRVADQIRFAGSKLVVLAGGRLSNEDLFNLKQLADAQGGTALLASGMDGGDLVARFGPPAGSNFKDMGKGTVILIVSCDLEQEAPVWWLRVKQAVKRGAVVIALNARRMAKLERIASHVLKVGYGQEAAMLDALLPGSKATADEILAAAKTFAAAQNAVVIYGSDGADLRTTRAIAEGAARLLEVTGHTGRVNNGLLAAWDHANDQGAWEMGFRPAADLGEALVPAGMLYVVGADPLADDPALAEIITQKANGLVVQDLFLTETAKAADVVLPALPFTHREGSFTNAERRVQRFYAALPAQPEIQPDYEITARIGRAMGLSLGDTSAETVFALLAKGVPAFSGLDYAALSETAPQQPILGRQDLYYGGTVYDNHCGLGKCLTAATEPWSAADLEATPPTRLPVVEGQSGVLVVPVTRLYDQGKTLLPPEGLHPRLTVPCVMLSPEEIKRLGLQDGGEARLTVNGRGYPVKVVGEVGLPAGVGLVPRSVGIPLRGPAAAVVERK